MDTAIQLVTPAMHYGWHGAGFGFGFLNFIGTILFFILMFALLRGLFRGWGYANGMRGPWGHRHSGWGRGGPWRAWMNGFGRDEAMETARERLARSEITPEQFDAIKKGLETRQNTEWDERHDSRGEWGRADWSRGWRGMMGRDEALEIARMRFARGEISAEEFEMIKRSLEN
jgi:putative membrane protein